MFEMFFILLTGLVFGALLAVIARVWWAGRFGKKKKAEEAEKARLEVRSSVEAIRAVGELVVLKAYTQQIVTKSDHIMGQWGEKWMTWLISAKKTAIIFEFAVDFRYNLQNPLFQIETFGESGVRMTLPHCHYEIQLKNIQFYDERAAALAPVLLPDWIGQVFGGRFTETEKNQLVAAAREKAEELAQELTARMMSEVRQSAETTLRSIARSMGFEAVVIHFSGDLPTQKGEVDVSRIEAEAESAIRQPVR